jgi:hypothetical protein
MVLCASFEPWNLWKCSGQNKIQHHPISLSKRKMRSLASRCRKARASRASASSPSISKFATATGPSFRKPYRKKEWTSASRNIWRRPGERGGGLEQAKPVFDHQVRRIRHLAFEIVKRGAEQQLDRVIRALRAVDDDLRRNDGIRRNS